MIIFGIVPGKRGGMAVLHDGAAPAVYPLPYVGKELDPNKFANLIRIWLKIRFNGDPKTALHCQVAAFVERTHAKRRPRLTPQAPSTAKKSSRTNAESDITIFNEGQAYGALRAVLETLHIETHLVPYRRWNQLILSGDRKNPNAAIEFCRARWPEAVLVPPGGHAPSEGIAKAVCLATYGEVVKREWR